MKKNNIDHLIRIMILIFILVSIFNSFLISYYVDKITGRVTTGTATLNILILSLRAPYNLEARLNPDNISIDLNWSEIEEAGSYTIYYSSNLTELQQINLTNLSPGITKVQGITDNNWTDWNAENIQKRYYTVSSVLGTLENLSKEIVGKCDLEYIADSTGEKGRNLLTLCMNVSYTAESFIQEVPNSTVIKQLNRWDDPEKEHWEGHTPGSPVYDFNMDLGKGYMIFVTTNFTHTLAGNIFKEPVKLEMISSSTGEKGRNLIGIPYSTLYYDAEKLVTEVPNATVIKQLNRWDNPEKEHWEGHTPGSPVYDFPININKGYMIFVTENSTWTPT